MRTVLATPRVGALLLTTAILVAVPVPAWADGLSSLTDPMRAALEGGSFGFALALVFAAGVLTSLTPCVYPMIAITVSVFGARKATSRRHGALLSLAFVLGISALFTPLGVASAMTGAAMGATNANPYVMIPLALVFVAMAASMFGAFELALPSALQNRLVQAGGSGYRGAFVIGFVNGLVAAPCTGPVLTVLLSWVATSRNAGFGALALFVYSLGLGLLFFLVGTFAIILPKSGRWLEGVKGVFGLVMLALAGSYVMPFLPFEVPSTRTTVWGAVSALLLLSGVAAGALHLGFDPHTFTRGQRIRKALGIALASAGALSGLAYAEALPPGASIQFRDDYEAARAEALRTHRPLLVDFGADWCGACKELDHTALHDPRVVREASRFIPVRVDLSAGRATPARWALLRSYRQPGLPLIVMHDSEGQESHRITGLVSADAVLRKLRATR